MVALILVGVVAAAGFWGLSQMVTTVDAILNGDAKLMQHALDLEARTLSLRCYEKDVFLNVADDGKVAEYAAKWKDSHAAAIGDLERLQTLITGEDTAAIGTMRKDLGTYSVGFEEILRGIGSRKIRTPAAANDAIAPYKDDLIFWRNVLIYFNRDTKAAVIDRLTRHLAPDGLLFLGHSETLQSAAHALRLVGPTAYARS